MSTSNSGLTAATTPLTGTEVMYVVQGGNSRKATTGNLYIPGGTDVAVTDGGTGASTALAARTNLGLVIGTDVQAHDADLDSWAGVTRASGYDTFAATPSSANLKALLTDETGSGAAVFATSPTLVTPAITGTNGAQSTLSAALNDSSSVAANAAKMWNPLYFGNAGTAVVHRLNRLLVGEATGNSSDIGPVTTKSWLETLLSSTVAASQLAVTSATGQLAMTGGARSSDFRTIFGAATGGAQGLTGIGYNNDTTPATTPIAAGVVGIAFQDAGVNGIALNQMDINNSATAVTPTTAGGVTSGSAWALGLTSGAYTNATTNATGALYIGRGSGTGPQFQTGIIVFDGALNTAIGAGGDGVAFEAHRGQSLRWQNAGATTDAEIWGAAAGLVTSKTIVPSANDGAALGTTALSFSDLFVASGAVLNFNNSNYTVTHSAGTLTFSAGSSWGAAPIPTTNDGAALGSTTNMWSDLFVASGAVLNFNNGNFTVTHSAGNLTLSGTTNSVGTINQGTSASANGVVSLQNGNSIELGNGRTADGTSNIDFHAESPDVDYSARLLRNTTTNGSFQILQNGTGGVSVTPGTGGFTIAGHLRRGTPVTKTGNFSLADTENWVIVNQAATTTVTLPAASTCTGREVTFKTIQAQTLVSASSNVVPLVGGAAATAILAATAGKWATLVSDGTNWIVMTAA